MTEPKLEPIKKEKLDSMFSDEKETSKKNKKKTKKNKKKNQIDLFDYAKENGLEINLQYEDVKPIDFDFQKINLNDNNKTNQTYNKQSNIEQKEKKIENEEKEKEINKKDKKKKNRENKKENKKDNFMKKVENNYENNEEENNEEKYDNFKYNEFFKNDNNNYKEQNYQNFRNDDKNYYYNNNNIYNNNKNYYNKKNYNNNYYNYNDYKNSYNNNNYKKKNNIAVEIPDNNFQKEETSNNQNNQNNNINIQNQINNLNNIQNNQINQINIQNNIFNPIYQANLMSNFQAEIMRMNYFSNMEYLNSNLYSPNLYMPMTESSAVEMLEKYFSEKNLNKDLNLRKNMDKETGNVPLEFILNLEKIKSMNLTEEKISQLINKVGSDRIEIINIDNKLYLRPKNYESIKNELISIEEIEEKIKQKNINQNYPQQNMQMGMSPMFFYPVEPMMYYNQMVPPQQNKENQPESNENDN